MHPARPVVRLSLVFRLERRHAKLQAAGALGGPTVAPCDGMDTSTQTGTGFFDDDPVTQRVLEIVLEHADVTRAQVAPDSRLFDIMDSLEVTETVMDLEDEFEASIPDDDVGTIQTVGQLIDYVKTHFPAPREKEKTPP